MHLFRDVSIQKKLTRITVISTTIMLVMVGVALLVHELLAFRSMMTKEMSALAGVIGTNSTAALAFNDAKAGEQTLAALWAHDEIMAARIYTKEGAAFATYRRAGIAGEPIPATRGVDGVTVRMRSMTFVKPILLDGERIGTIYLQSDMEELYGRLREHTVIVLGVLVFASLVALALSSRLQGMIAQPIRHLAHMVKTVTEQYDYSVRAIKFGEDELGLLTDGFNEMLAQIQARDAALQEAREELEERVNLRTHELQLEVAERRRAEESLKKLSHAVEQTADSVFITDREGIIEYVNPAFARQTGYTRDEAIGQTPRLLKSGQHPQQFYTRLWQTLLAGEVFRGVIVNKRKDGTLFYEEKVLTPLKDGQGAITHFVSAGRDITERKVAEAALAAAHADLARSYETTKEHAARWEALFMLSRLLNRSLNLEEVFGTFAQAVKSYVPYDRLGVIVPEADQLHMAYSVADPPLLPYQGKSWPKENQTGIDWVLTHRAPRLVPDLAKEAWFKDDVYMAQEGIRATIELPLVVGGEVAGVFFLDSRTEGTYSTKDIERLLPLADQMALVMNHSRLFRSLQRQAEELRSSRERLRALAGHLESVREDERTRIAREIHDELGQLLTGLKIDLSWVAARLPKDQPALQEKARMMGTLIDTTIQSVRRIASELRPGLLDDLGLMPAIEWQAQEFQARTGIRTQLTAQPSELELDRDHSTAVFRILQEALTNVARHAQGTRVHINLKADAERLIMEVIDNGKGITQQELVDRTSLGLLGMRERAHLLGGGVTILGLPGQGTTVTVVMPLHRPADGHRSESNVEYSPPLRAGEDVK